ncbi:MAG: class I SAM-dependent methyltransferase, partial [Candidatus Omnitrophica bacterium]|nr:class I SAM-dependent methyltransferase [Candidatus Omnitrophota bacterium]
MKTQPYENYLKKHCRYCGQDLTQPFLDLGAMPLANSYVTKEGLDQEEFQCPLSLTWCSNCGLVQLTHVVPPSLMFSHYLYVSSTTQTFRNHFADYAKAIKEKLPRRQHYLAIDIGSNDGLLLSCYQKVGMKAVGIEPARNLSDEANRQGLCTINRYFDTACVHQVLRECGPADVISANNVFAHIDDISGVCRNVRTLLRDDGMFVIEFPYLGVMLEKLCFDMIYHEHLSYIAVHPLNFILGRFGLEIWDIQEVASHGGSLRVFIGKTEGCYLKSPIIQEWIAEEETNGYLTPVPYKQFAGKVQKVKQDFLDWVHTIKASRQSIAGYGAPAKASTIINYYGLSRAEIDYIVDDNPLKQNLFVPGARIPIVSSSYLEAHPPDYIVI